MQRFKPAQLLGGMRCSLGSLDGPGQFGMVRENRIKDRWKRQETAIS